MLNGWQVLVVIAKIVVMLIISLIISQHAFMFNLCEMSLNSKTIN